MAAHTQNTSATHNPAFDALRGILTLLVVLHHTALTYGAIGDWFYRELPTDRSAASTLLVFFCTVNQAFFMGLFFLLAGYYTPASIEQKGARRYLLGRLVRLGLPLLFFGWVMGPVTIALVQTTHGRPFMDTLQSLWRSGHFENGPLWFAQALLIFAVAAVLWLHLFPRRPAPHDMPPWPSNTALAIAALVTGGAALALRQTWPVGVNVWGLQLGFFASYVLLFAFGCVAAGPQWLERLQTTQVRTWRRVALVTLPVLAVVYFLHLPVDGVYAFWEPLVAWGVILVLLDRFQRRFNTFDRASSALARRAYTIYVIHPPVLVGVALGWREVPAPAMLKFAVTGSISCVLCFVVAGWLLRLPSLRRVM
jgi:peptidoglycan/LPS O-acetylase OafA/YrhL